MFVKYGYKCKRCGKIYPCILANVPELCKKCGATLILSRFFCNYKIGSWGNVVYKTPKKSLLEDYDDVKITHSNDIERIKIYKKTIFSRWKELKESVVAYAIK